MRLLNRTLIILVLSAFFIAGFSSVVQFYWVKNKIEERVDRKLFREKKFIKKQLKDIEPKDGFSYNTERASVKFLMKNNTIAKDSLFYGEVLDEDGEKTMYRTLLTYVNIKDQNFKVEIRKEVEETETFIQSIYLTFLMTLFLVLLIFILLKYYLLKNTWLPFFETLHKLQISDFQNDQIKFDDDIKIKEFKDLNNELNILSNKVYDEFQSQKTFTENVNHELMTPLAIIRGKLELIIQSEHLKEQDLKLVSDIFVTIDRLTKLNKSLVLLSKMDNHQFEDKISVNVQELIDEILNSLEDQIRSQEIKVRKAYNLDINLNINEMLAYILFSNIIKNAIFHNKESKGFIKILLDKNKVEVSNSGKNSNTTQQNIFDRFVKESSSEDSIGLGLSIVQKICDQNKIKIQYEQENDVHTFRLIFQPV